ncbi:MAG: MMPL family transporter, partial [Patescibacteria group bacterium]
FGNIRQTGIALCCLLSGLIWARGSVGLLQEAGVEIQGKMLYETVYFSLVFTSLIVSGISFVERKFDSYNETRKKHPGKTRAQVWAQTKANPAELIDERIIMTGLVAIFGFGTLYQVEIRQIMEVGIFSAIGLTFMLILTLYLVPALHILAGGEFRLGARSLPGKWWLLLDKTVKKCYQWSCPKGENTSLSAFHRRGVKAGAGVAALAILVAGVIGAGALSDGFEPVKVKTEPLEFIQETLLYKTSQDVNKPGEYGFDRAMFILRPAENARPGPAIYRPKFLQKAEDLQTGLEADPVLENHVRYIHSAVDMVKVVSRENYGHSLPRTKGQAVDSFRLLRAELGMPGQQQLWGRNGLVIYASTSATDSNAMETVVNRTLEVANRDFPELRVDTFGKVATYAGADKYLRERQAANTATQIFWIFLFTAIWIGWRNWRFRRKEQSFFLSSYGSGLAISLPFIFASAMMAGVIMLFRIPFDQATACITALTVNAAIDFSLYVVADYQAGLLAGGNRADGIKYAVLTRGRVVLIDVAINSACFAPLMLSPFTPIARIGWMMMVMLAFCGFGAMVILPTVLPLATRPNK